MRSELVLLLAFLGTLASTVVLAITEHQEAVQAVHLPEVLLALGGALAGVSIASRPSGGSTSSTTREEEA